MNRKLLLILFLAIPFCVESQTRRHGVVTDTILIQKEMLGRQYYLQGKRLNTYVMEWFMVDYKEANVQIRSSMFADNLSVVAYSVGALSLLGGLLVSPKNEAVAKDLLKTGGISIGGGVLFQVVSGSYKKRAVKIYNEKVNEQKIGGTALFHMKLSDSGLGVAVRLGTVIK